MSWQYDSNSGTMQWVNDGMGDPSEAGRVAAGTGVKGSGDQTKASRESANRARLASIYGGDGSLHYDEATGSFINSAGAPVSDAAYEQVAGAGAAAEFREGAKLLGATAGQTTPTGNVAATTDDALKTYTDATNRTSPRPPSAADWAALAGAGPAPNAAFGVAGRQQTQGVPSIGAINGFQRPDLEGAFGMPAAGPAAPTVDRSKIDPLLGGISTYANDIYALSKDNTGLSAAEAQLQQATKLANINAAIQTDASQRAALGAARGARNRGDRALLEQQAIGEAGYIGQDAARTAALRQAENEGNLATLRANEENADREFKLKALEKASQLGLNTAALELDVSKANLGAASSMLNNQFQLMGIDKQLSSQEAMHALDFAKDMAAIQYRYDELSVTDQNEADRLLMQKYDIDQDTMVALKKIKAESGWDWNKFAAGLITGVTPVVAKKVLA